MSSPPAATIMAAETDHRQPNGKKRKSQIQKEREIEKN